MDVYDKIDKLLKEHKMSRRKLAAIIGIPQSTLTSAFKSRSNTFSVEQLTGIAEAFDMPVHYFLFDDPEVIAKMDKGMDAAGEIDEKNLSKALSELSIRQRQNLNRVLADVLENVNDLGELQPSALSRLVGLLSHYSNMIDIGIRRSEVQPDSEADRLAAAQEQGEYAKRLHTHFSQAVSALDEHKKDMLGLSDDN